MMRARMPVLSSLPLLQRQRRRHAGAFDERAADIPPSFDARQQWPDCISIGTLRNQGSCGACYAMAAVEVLEDRICIAQSARRRDHTAIARPLTAHAEEADAGGGQSAPMCPGAPHVQHGRKARLPVGASDCLSVQYMVGCDMHDSGCDGGYIDNAWQFLATRGVPSEACDPYSYCTYPQLKNCTHPNATTPPARGLVQHPPLDNNTCPSKCADGSEMARVKAKAAYAAGMPGDVESFQREIMRSVRPRFSCRHLFIRCSFIIHLQATGAYE